MVSRIRVVSLVTLALTAWFTISPAPAQVTYGQKPQLPAPFETKSAGNGPSGVVPPDGFMPTAPTGFHVNVFAKDFKVPRFMITAPNGDIFVAETGAGNIVVLRDPQHTGGASERENFATGLKRPFGIAFHDDYVYVGNMNSLVRFKYDPKTSKRLSESEFLMKLPAGGHITRTLAFSPDGKKLYLSIGSE